MVLGDGDPAAGASLQELELAECQLIQISTPKNAIQKTGEIPSSKP